MKPWIIIAAILPLQGCGEALELCATGSEGYWLEQEWMSESGKFERVALVHGFGDNKFGCEILANAMAEQNAKFPVRLKWRCVSV